MRKWGGGGRGVKEEEGPFGIIGYGGGFGKGRGSSSGVVGGGLV